MTTLALVPSEPARLARATIAHHSKSFSLASRLLGERLRDQTAVVYAWCRRADDAIDDGPADPREALAILDDELVAAYAGRATDPVLAAFGEVARARALPILYPRELLAGMAMDVDGTHYRTTRDLIPYAYRVAGTVGLMMCHVFGIKDDDALVHAAHLGIAMQLTNICRDVDEDRRRGRQYLPADLVAAYGTAGAVERLLAVADRYYRSADRGIAALPYRAAVAVRAARSIYAAIGDELARQRHDTSTRAVVGTPKKLALAAGAFARVTLAAPARLASRRATIPQRILELSDVPEP